VGSEAPCVFSSHLAALAFSSEGFSP